MKKRLAALVVLVALVGLAAATGCGKRDRGPPEIPKDGLKGVTPRGSVSSKPLDPLP
jgi:hypothetical protein